MMRLRKVLAQLTVLFLKATPADLAHVVVTDLALERQQLAAFTTEMRSHALAIL